MGGIQVADALVFDEATHRYTVGGKVLPGITSVLKMTGFVDDRWFTQEARDRGTATHRACWFMAEGELDWATVDPEIRPRVEAFGRFLEEHKPTLLFAEKPLHSDIYRFAGTFDFVFDVPALGICIIEVKTGAAGLAAMLQTAGQKVLIEERMGFKGIKRFAFELTAEGRYKFVPHLDLGDKLMFLNAVAMVHRRINAGELKI